MTEWREECRSVKSWPLEYFPRYFDKFLNSQNRIWKLFVTRCRWQYEVVLMVFSLSLWGGMKAPKPTEGWKPGLTRAVQWVVCGTAAYRHRWSGQISRTRTTLYHHDVVGGWSQAWTVPHLYLPEVAPSHSRPRPVIRAGYPPCPLYHPWHITTNGHSLHHTQLRGGHTTCECEMEIQICRLVLRAPWAPEE